MNHEQAERIAIALERIAAALEPKPKDGRQHNSFPAHRQAEFAAALSEHADMLSGRMTLPEIINIIGVKVRHGDRMAIGKALTEFGALKGRTGSQRYYVFN